MKCDYFTEDGCMAPEGVVTGDCHECICTTGKVDLHELSDLVTNEMIGLCLFILGIVYLALESHNPQAHIVIIIASLLVAIGGYVSVVYNAYCIRHLTKTKEK